MHIWDVLCVNICALICTIRLNICVQIFYMHLHACVRACAYCADSNDWHMAQTPGAFSPFLHTQGVKPLVTSIFLAATHSVLCRRKAPFLLWSLSIGLGRLV